MKDVGSKELGSEDQDFGRGKDMIDQNLLSQKQGEVGHPQFVHQREVATRLPRVVHVQLPFFQR